jgi:penicillin V acylase-like amidase (Ntn superfamily)
LCQNQDMRVIIAVVMLLLAARAQACTGFCAAARDLVLAGNNEDYTNPSTRIWFVPGGKGTYGRVYVGFDNLFPQGGMNERGLFFDGFATERVPAVKSAGKETFRGNLADRAMAECGTVEEVIALFEKYDRSFLERGILLFADANGGSVAIEANAIVRKRRRYQVQTNFHQSLVPPEKIRCPRFKIADSMLAQAGEEISVDLFRRILANTHVEGPVSTLYSNVYDLKRRVMYLYHFHNYENVVTIDLAEELKKGPRVLELPSLFPRTYAGEAFARAHQPE